MAEPSAASHGHRVRLEANKGQTAPPGVWRCVDRSPDGTGHWWILPSDREATEWLADPRCPLRMIQGCISWPSRLMRPPDVARLF
jgi:hypothetical protein